MVLIAVLIVFTTLTAEEEARKAPEKKPVPGAETDKEKPQYDGGMVYLKVGGAILFDERRVLPEAFFGFGYRYEQGDLGIDLSFFNESIGPTVDHEDYQEETAYDRNKVRITLSRWANLSFYWIAEPVSWHSFYVGGGLAIETLDLEILDDVSSQTGLSVTATAGWEFMRERRVTLFGQLEATLPCYTGRFENDRFWIPSFVFVVGAGF
jgi:hypothetical protein